MTIRKKRAKIDNPDHHHLTLFKPNDSENEKSASDVESKRDT